MFKPNLTNKHKTEGPDHRQRLHPPQRGQAARHPAGVEAGGGGQPGRRARQQDGRARHGVHRDLEI